MIRVYPLFPVLRVGAPFKSPSLLPKARPQALPLRAFPHSTGRQLQGKLEYEGWAHSYLGGSTDLKTTSSGSVQSTSVFISTQTEAKETVCLKA